MRWFKVIHVPAASKRVPAVKELKRAQADGTTTPDCLRPRGLEAGELPKSLDNSQVIRCASRIRARSAGNVAESIRTPSKIKG